ncbi:MAG: sigma-70 family RNA polymerase sigma factor [Thermoanaerobaculia bacterium]|nr:sigma-70 family RNA polymerase sigma factor [Thermoanaerobaculia bacterium]
MSEAEPGNPQADLGDRSARASTSSDEELSDARLIARVQGGDTVAFGHLVDRHKDAMVNYLTKLTGSREEAEDYAQEAFLRLYERAASYRERGYFKAYLYRIATNLVRSAERRRKRWRVVHSLISTNGHHAEPRQQQRVLRGEIGGHLRQAVADLPLHYRLPLVLYEVDEWPYRRIAEFLGCREGTVKSRIHRGRNMIRERLEPYVNGGTP